MPAKYRFRRSVDDFDVYPDGSEVPRRFSMIVKEQPDGTWETVGYAEIRLLRIKRDESGVEDVSIGFAGLVNPEDVE